MTCSLALLGVSAVLLSASAEKLTLQKCCDSFEMFAADGWNCGRAPWAHNLSLLAWQGAIVAPHRQHWLDAWLPPGLPVEDLGRNLTVQPKKKGSWAKTRSVNESLMWSARDPNRTYGPNVLLLDGSFVWRPRPSGGFRKARYCVDNAPPPKGPYLARLDVISVDADMVFKCCFVSHLLTTNASGHIYCAKDASSPSWTPSTSPALSPFDPEVNYGLRIVDPAASFFIAPPPSDGATYARALLGRRFFETFHSTAWGPCADYFKDADGALREVMGFPHTLRPARAAYWVTRYFSFVSVAVLAAALAAVAANPRMRTTVHGWALACHAGCLLLFNALQVAYTLSTSHEVDKGANLHHGPLATRCLAFGFCAYFLQTAAGWWLTAVCLNMTHGFRLEGAGARKQRSKRLFRWLSALAWGAAVALTILCGAVMAAAPRSDALTWYQPSLMETRTCYSEMKKQAKGASVKWGTLLYFYGPMCALVLLNVAALGTTARRVNFLRRGNSMLRRDEREVQRAQDSSGTAAAEGTRATARGGKTAGSDPQSVIVYLKLLLSAGGAEMITETCAWAVTRYEKLDEFSNIYTSQRAYYLDHTFAYRCAGYCADLLRALIVLWLCSPDKAALRALCKRVRGMTSDGSQQKF